MSVDESSGNRPIFVVYRLRIQQTIDPTIIDGNKKANTIVIASYNTS